MRGYSRHVADLLDDSVYFKIEFCMALTFASYYLQTISRKREKNNPYNVFHLFIFSTKPAYLFTLKYYYLPSTTEFKIFNQEFNKDNIQRSASSL